MTNFTDFFPVAGAAGSGGGGAEINQYYLPGVVDQSADTFTDSNGAVYLKTGITAAKSTYPNAYSAGFAASTSNYLPGFTNNRGAFINLPGENKYITITDGPVGSNIIEWYLVDRTSLPPVTPIPSITQRFPVSSVDSRYYTPAVLDWNNNKKYSFSTTAANNITVSYSSGFQADPKISEVTGNWPNYTAVSSQSITFATAGILPGYSSVTNGWGVSEAAFRPTITGVSDPTGKGFVMFRMADDTGLSFYFTFSIADGTCRLEPNIVTGTVSGMGYSLMTQLDNGKLYFSSRYGISPHGPELVESDPATLTQIGSRIFLENSAQPASTPINAGGGMKGGTFVQGGSADSFYSSVVPGNTSNYAVVNEIAPSVGIGTAKYVNLTDVSGTSLVSQEDQRLYVKMTN
jgi:hypothetical protein